MPRSALLVCWALLSGAAALATHNSQHVGDQQLAKAQLRIPVNKLNPDEVSPVKVPKIEVNIKTSEVFPVPTSSRCVVIMVFQYMVIHTALALLRAYYSCSYTQPLVKYKTRAVTNAAQTMTYAPMLCVLFIACRMRVEFLADGKGDAQVWVQHCMYALTFAVMANSIVVLIYPLVFGTSADLRPSGDLERPRFSPRFQAHLDYQCKFYTLMVVRCLILLCLYGGIGGVIVGIFLYTPPGESDLTKVPKPAPPVMCTMILTVAFFLSQLVIVLCQSYTDIKGIDYYAGHIDRVTRVMNDTSTTLEFAPMVAIVFLAARMRSLQHDSEPQEWAQSCMYVATWALIVTAALAILVPCVCGGRMKTNPTTKEVTFEVPDKALSTIMMVIRFLSVICFYAGVGGVICSIYTFRAPTGYQTAPVSPTVNCIVTLAFQFFFVYAALICCFTISEVSGGQLPLERYRFYSAIEAAKSTLPWAPMLAILFLTTRMYALLITDKRGSPQGWVQDAMCMSTWSLLISFVSVLVTGILAEEDEEGKLLAVETDEEGNVVNKFENSYVTHFMTGLRYFTPALLYGGIITVIVGLCVMTPETANGRGSIPIVSHIRKATQR